MHVLNKLGGPYFNVKDEVTDVLDTNGQIKPFRSSSFSASKMILQTQHLKESQSGTPLSYNEIKKKYPKYFRTQPSPPPPMPNAYMPPPPPPMPRTTNGTKKSQNKRTISPNRTKLLDDIRNNTKKLKSASNRKLQQLSHKGNTQKITVFEALKEKIGQRKSGRNIQSKSSSSSSNNTWQ